MTIRKVYAYAGTEKNKNKKKRRLSSSKRDGDGEEFQGGFGGRKHFLQWGKYFPDSDKGFQALGEIDSVFRIQFPAMLQIESEINIPFTPLLEVLS